MRSLKLRQPALIIFFACILLSPLKGFSNTGNSSLHILMVGKTLPDAQLESYGIANVDINSLKGKIKIISNISLKVINKIKNQLIRRNK